MLYSTYFIKCLVNNYVFSMIFIVVFPVFSKLFLCVTK